MVNGTTLTIRPSFYCSLNYRSATGSKTGDKETERCTTEASIDQLTVIKNKSPGYFMHTILRNFYRQTVSAVRYTGGPIN